MKILVVEDDSILREALVTFLEEENFQVDIAATGDEGYYAAQQGIHDIIILDIMLPVMDGFEILRQLRKEGNVTPILFLTARDSIDDRVKGLESGADDYLVKPFALREALARIRALLRRKGNLAAGSEPSYGLICLDRANRDAKVGEQPLGLTAKEFDLLEFLILNKEQTLSREQLFDRIWGLECDTGIGIVDLYIHYLRKKLTPHNLDSWVKTVRGAGFVLKEK